MAYIVSGQTGQCSIVHVLMTPVQALQKALEMIDAGCTQATIEDQSTEAFKRADFDNVYLSIRP